MISFTGSAKTGIGIRSNPNLLRHSVKFIAEQDSLNACILGQDVKIGEIEWNSFLKEVVNEITLNRDKNVLQLGEFLYLNTNFKTL